MSARSAWLFSPRIDLAVFGGSFLVSCALLAVGVAGGWTVGHGDTPGWAWVTAVLLVDVAHVWSTGFRVYFDPREVSRRPLLYLGVPGLAYLVLQRLYAAGPLVFWRALAYLAIFHFVRQQAGWMALYRARSADRSVTTRLVDTAAIYAATVYPLVYWHTHARSFDWFVAGDVLRAPPWLDGVDALARPAYVAALAVYALRAVSRTMRGLGSPGKDVLVATTAACWYAGIVAFDSDYAFTVTNVFIHGIPYVALVVMYGRAQPASEARPAPRVAGVLATIWALAYVEELVWDRAVWHDRPGLFGAAWDVGRLEGLLVPLLALPQVTHYVLDGFLWRRPQNPGLGHLFAPAGPDDTGLARAGESALG